MVAALFVFTWAARTIEYHPDESHTTFNTRYFEYLFIQHDVGRREWADNYWTHTHPMVTRYILGAWLRTRGYDLEQMPPPHDWSKNQQENRRLGYILSPELLADARAAWVLLASVVTGLLFLLGRVLAGPLAGLTAAVLAMASPLAQERFVKVVNETPLMLFVLLSLLVAVLGVRRGRDGGLPIRWALALGAVLGLAIGTKLTAALSVAAFGAWAGLAVVLAAARPGGGGFGSRLRRAGAVVRGWVLVPPVMLGVFLLSDPHLYGDPVLHTRHLIDSRVDESLAVQQQDRRAIFNPLDRPRYVLGGSLTEGTASGSRKLPLEAVLAGIGFAALLVRSGLGWRAGGTPTESLLLVTAVVYFIGISAGLVVNWTRWLVPTLVLGFLLSGIGASTLVGLAGAGIGVLRRREAPARGAPAAV